MERVIMLKWFKTITNRLFGEDDNDEKQEIDKMQEIEELESQEGRSEKPVFRFPIITDAEIYGWDEEEPKIESKQGQAVSSDEKQDDYEPIPLYENDRWPENTVPVNVYKANEKPVYNKEIERTYFSPELKPEFTRGSKFEKVIKKSPASRFVPTDVPSPIHGYVSRARKNDNFVLEEVEEVVETKQHSLLKDDFVLEPYVPEDVFQQEETSDLSTIQDTREMIAEEEVELVTAVFEEEPFEEFLEEPAVTEILDDPVVEEIPQELIEEDILLENPILNEPVLEEVLEESKERERIVPFNVLMLKSDKVKLEQIEKKAPILEQPQIKPEEKRLQKEKEVEPIQTPILEADEELEHYVFPSIEYLIPPESQIEDTEWLTMQSEKLEESLSHFGVTATVIDAVQGPTVTRFEFTVGQGTKVSRVRNLTDDLKLTLAARDIRIQAPIPGKSSIGIEIPNRQTRPVRISEVIQTDAFMNSSSPLEAVLGLGLTGEPVTLDLRKMPHGMIAGATGSGKSVCINSVLVSLLYKASPSDLKMMLIDPKMVELAPFNGIPHLISPVITDVKAATAALKWAVNEMERRYELLAHAGVRDIERYNKAATENRQYSLKMPYLLIVIDELADLMMMAPADVEVSISRIAQKARACGIHLIIATQRPSVDVITGTIKANIPTRIAFSVSSQVDSRTIIDTNGAERLLGRGDMLYIGNGESTSVRLQGTFVTDDEIERIIEHVQNEASPTYLFGQEELLKSAVEEEEEDSLFPEACLFVFQQDSASTSMLQRNFSIGYNRAAKLMDRMEKYGFISAQQGSKARDVYVTESELKQLTEPAF